MTIKKRLRVILAALFQSWHVQRCGECGFSWMAVGEERPELIRICDRCEVEQLDRMLVYAEAEYQRQTKGAL